MADGLRMGAIKRKVYKDRGRFGALGYRAKGYRWARDDVVRVTGRSVYTAWKRVEFLGRLPKPAQPLTELLYEELDTSSRRIRFSRLGGPPPGPPE